MLFWLWQINRVTDQGVAQMKNLNPTRWLEMVWTALAEQDQRKRDQLLGAAHRYLQSELLRQGEDHKLSAQVADLFDQKMAGGDLVEPSLPV